MGWVHIVFVALSLYIYQDGAHAFFLSEAVAELITGLLGLLFLWWRKPSPQHFDAILITVSTWIVLSGLGALPFIGGLNLSVVDGLFESVSAITTTGATVLSGLDVMPKTILMYRQFLQWMGGLGIVIFVVAIFPVTGSGGGRLIRVETPGPLKDERVSPRMADSSRYLVYVYLWLTGLCAGAYYLAGMSSFDAIAHSFTTIATGGFSTYDASMGAFNSALILWVSTAFMFLGGMSFALHFMVFYRRKVSALWESEELRAFFSTVLWISLVVSLGIYSQGWDSLGLSLTHGFFLVVSFITTTGYGAYDLSVLPLYIPLILIICGYLGGCSGSTAGGNKMIRNIITYKEIMLELKQIIHPNGVFTLKFQGKPLDEKVRSSVVMFMGVAALMTVVFTMLLIATGVDFWTALTATAACLNVLGPGFGEVASNFSPLSDSAKLLLTLAMLLGRLEYAVFFVVFAVMLRRV